MRPWPVLALLLTALLAGCADTSDDEQVSPPDLGYDPSDIRPTGVRKESFDVTSFDGTPISTVVYTPLTTDTLPNGSAPQWPTVVFLHGWGFFKEQFEGTEAMAPGFKPPEDSDAPEELGNILARFAAEGFVAVAYDARGFGRSGGQTTIAGPAEMADLSAVLDRVQADFDTGRIGLLGVSYGAGQALISWGQDPRVETAVAVFGWQDLYEALMPNDVPKLEWAQTLFALGAGGSGGQVHPMLAEWYAKSYTREGLDGMRAQFDVRSVGDRLGNTTKPLFVCQGLQESLTHQVQELGTGALGYTRTYVYTGGHNFIDTECLERSVDWFHFFLGGFRTGVERWPALETQDVDDSGFTSYDTWPTPPMDVFYLRAPDLVRGPGNGTFTIQQRLTGNPFAEPAVVGDLQGPAAEIPDQLRRDPGGIAFSTAPLPEKGILIGTPTLRLVTADPNATQWQVAAQLVHVGSDGQSRIIGRGAYAQVEENGTETATITFPFTRAKLEEGDTISLRLSSNDPSWWMPLFADYTVSFTGGSSLHLPIQR